MFVTYTYIWQFSSRFSVALCPECEAAIPEALFKTIFWLGYCNSMMNPIIYGFSSREFKRAFRRILRCDEYGKKARPLHKTIDSSASNSEINHPSCNLITRNSRQNGHSNYIPYRQYDRNNSMGLNSPFIGEVTLDNSNSLSPPRRSHCVKYMSSDWRSCSCDSETASLSENQMEALRLEQMEHNSMLWLYVLYTTQNV